MGIPKYPKVLAIGHRTIAKLFDGPVEVTEKIDGSQFSFGKPAGELVCRTRRTNLVVDLPDSMFRPAVEHVKTVEHLLDPDFAYFGETLAKPKHNVLAYDRVPKGHVALFGVMDIRSKEMLPYKLIEWWADTLGMDVVALLDEGVIEPHAVRDYLTIDSMLGGTTIEGVVIKNYAHDAMIGDAVYYPYLVGKYVSERFKERAGNKAYGSKSHKQTLDEYFASFRTEARWRKAIQHLKEDGTFLGEPKDIGPLIKEIQLDFIAEELDNVKARLWKEYQKHIMSSLTKGFPEWFKEQLLEGKL